MTVNELIEKLSALPDDVRERDVLIDGMSDIDWSPSAIYIDPQQEWGWWVRRGDTDVKIDDDGLPRAVIMFNT